MIPARPAALEAPRALAAALAVLGLWASDASGLGAQGKPAPREEYLSRLGKLVGAYAESELALSAWCGAAGLQKEAESALERARAAKPGAEAPAPPKPPAPEDLAAEHAEKVKALRASVGRDYAALARWCLSKGLLREARRSVEKALRWNPSDSEAKSLALKPALKARYMHDVLSGSPQGVFKGGKWVAEEGFRKAQEPRVRALAEAQSKASGLEFKSDFLPDVDMLYTVKDGDFKAVKSAVERFVGITRGLFFLGSPKKPLLLFYIRSEEEFRKLGQNPAMMGAYEWGKGKLYAYPGFMGDGTILHEMTHAMLEASFRTFPPLWFNEGLACFFEAFDDLSGENPFGIVNWRDSMYAQQVSAGTARSLEALVRDCVLMIDPQGYGQGRALMNYLWGVGKLEAFVVSAQLKDDGKLDFAAVLSEVLGRPLSEAGADLEKFAAAHAKAGEKIPRGKAEDEALDGAIGPAPGQD